MNSPVLGQDGEVVYIIHSVEDVTELIRVTAAKEAASYLSAIGESSDDAIFSETLDGIITTWNKSSRTHLRLLDAEDLAFRFRFGARRKVFPKTLSVDARVDLKNDLPGRVREL